jgi:hypothetical protein
LKGATFEVDDDRGGEGDGNEGGSDDGGGDGGDGVLTTITIIIESWQ